TGDAALAGCLVVVAPELALQHAVDAAQLLLLPQVHAVIRQLLPVAPVLARRIRTPIDGALIGEAFIALQEKLFPLAPAKSANGADVSCHALSSPPILSNSPPLGGTAPVVGNGGHVLDDVDLQPCRLQG